MPTVIVHLEIAILFGIVFAISSLLWDLDHVTKCSSGNLVNAVFNHNDAEYQIENQEKGGCRGFTHSLAFGIAFTAFYLGYLIHMIMDTKGGIGI